MLKKVLLASILAIACLPQTVHAAAPRINLTPSPVTLTEGQSQLITITLDEPIIAGSGSAFVQLTITPTHPDRISVNTPTVTIPGDEWSTPHTFTITAIDNHVVDGDVTDNFTITTDSNSEYYDNFAPALRVNVLDNDVADPAPTVLPAVGSGFGTWLSLGSAFLVASFAAYKLIKIQKS